MTFKALIMKGLFNISTAGLIVMSALALSGCTELETSENRFNLVSQEQEPENSPQPAVITVGLPGTDPDTKLAYEEITFNGRRALKTSWCEGDALTANALPGSKDAAYTFNLIGGQGTRTGVFECTHYKNGYAPTHFSTNSWTMYFPGSIENDADYLTFSYAGQVQTGNGNMDHLKDFHTIRLSLYSESESRVFDTGYIDFSGDGLDQSGCMKFNLSGLPAGIVPVKLTLTYISVTGTSDAFYTHNILRSYFGPVPPNGASTNSLSLGLAGFGETTSITAYMMLSNADMNVKAGGRFKVTVDTEDGTKYFCEKPINANVTLKGGTLNSITCTSWTEADKIDGFNNPEGGIFVLQEATAGTGTDIVIMGDGFSATDAHFGAGGDYHTIMTKAYEDFFSVEPYKTLKPYFNVYYINAVSKDDHDAVPDAYNGATQGSASTIFSTEFIKGSTIISGDTGMVLQYAAQAIRTKGGKDGSPVTDENEIYTRAHKGLSIVMINVACHAGTCNLSWSISTTNDFGNSYSVAFTALGNSPEQRRWTMIHEAGGHGFGKLADEYGGYIFTRFTTGIWNDLAKLHTYGVQRNVNEYYAEGSRWTLANYPYTTASSVYWSDLLGRDYDYTASEGLGLYEGGYTYNEMFCRPTENSIMRSQHSKNGQFFNAISRWAIWYRLMRLTGGTSASQFKDSLDEFIAFDNTLNITMSEPLTRSAAIQDAEIQPTAPPVMIPGRWENGRFVPLQN